MLQIKPRRRGSDAASYRVEGISPLLEYLQSQFAIMAKMYTKVGYLYTLSWLLQVKSSEPGGFAAEKMMRWEGALASDAGGLLAAVVEQGKLLGELGGEVGLLLAGED